MSRWFRHYAGMMRDDKLVRAALKSRQPIERVVWIWGAVLESAAEIDDAGRFDLDAAEVAYFLRADEPDVVAVLRALEELGRTAEGHVVRWGDRQFQSDRSAERQKRYRERRASERDGDVLPAPSDARVTVASRHGDAPETETDNSEPNGSSSPKQARPKATKRCPAEWSPSEADLAVGFAEGFSSGELERELSKIRDHLFKTAHSDWSAVYRNWLRRASEGRKPRHERPRPDPRQAAFVDRLEAVDSAMAAAVQQFAGGRGA